MRAQTERQRLATLVNDLYRQKINLARSDRASAERGL